MVDPVRAQTRGFYGRPLIALLFAVAMGISAYYAGVWLHLSGVIVYVIMAAIFGLVHYFWQWAEKSK